MKSFLILLFAFLFFPFCNTYSQNLLSIRSLSMGNTSVANSYEIDALNQNPANILNQRSNNNASVYFNILTNFGFLTSSKYLSMDFYDNYFAKQPDGNTRTLTEADKNTILADASNQPSSITGSAKVLALVINTNKFGSFGASIDERFTANFKVSRDFLDLALFGNIANNIYDFSEMEINAYWTRELNLTYAHRLKMKKNKFFDALSFGISVKPQFGLYYVKTTKNNLVVSTNNFNVIRGTGEMHLVYSGLTSDNDFKYSLDNAGFGIGFDFGVNAALKNISRRGKLNIGLSITDIGTIKWKKNASDYFYDGNFAVTDITNKAQLDSLRDKIKGTKTPIAEFSEGLPTILRAGVSFKLYRDKKIDSLNLELATFSIDYIQGLNENLGSSKKPIVGIGAEVNVTKVFAPRIGVAIGGPEEFVTSFGLGIDVGAVLFDLGTYNISSIFKPKGTSKLSAGLSIKFKI